MNKMATKKQVYEVVLETTDEELDGERLIQELIENAYKNSGHVKNVEVNEVTNEWSE